MKLSRFEDLECWQEARSLVRTVYAVTRDGAFKKDLRLSGQIQAAAASVMANIAEGFIRRSMALSSTKVKDDTWLQSCPCDKGC